MRRLKPYRSRPGKISEEGKSQALRQSSRRRIDTMRGKTSTDRRSLVRSSIKARGARLTAAHKPRRRGASSSSSSANTSSSAAPKKSSYRDIKTSSFVKNKLSPYKDASTNGRSILRKRESFVSKLGKDNVKRSPIEGAPSVVNKTSSGIHEGRAVGKNLLKMAWKGTKRLSKKAINDFDRENVRAGKAMSRGAIKVWKKLKAAKARREAMIEEERKKRKK